MRSVLLFLIIVVILVSVCPVFGEEKQFPTNEIKDIKAVELYPNESMVFIDYAQKVLQKTTDYDWWSTIYHQKLPKFTLTTSASSTLNNSISYKSANLCDGKAGTAWVEGAKGNGIGEWVKFHIDASTSFPDAVTNNPFSLDEIGVLPGYAKSLKTWSENNRVKKLLVVAYSPKLAQNEWVVYRLNLKDENKLQIFTIPEDKIGYSIQIMKKDIWIKIEDIYKGTKYDDTCISEFVAVGGFSN
ncbi:MAG: hypothetical protein K6U80_20410 [Firmicutes bacterium]|nr:hypothetical protein [Bacillota bacterium]